MLVSRSSNQGSIGAAAIGYDQYNNRIKGFSSFSILNSNSAMRLKEIVRAQEEQNPQSTRTTIRALVSNHLIDELSNNGLGKMEARIDISNVDSSMSLAYFGRNAPSRRAPQHIVSEESASIEKILQIRPTTRESALARLTSEGYKIEQLKNPTQQQVQQLADLYRATFSAYTFELNEQSVQNMCSNGNIVLTTVSPQNQIVGALVAEHATIEVDSSQISLYELSDYATSRQHRGNGAMTAMQIEVINLIRSLSNGNEAIIYSENRAPWTPVSVSSHKTGLMDYSGTLEKHCIIESDRDIQENGNMENLHVFAARGY